MTFSIGQYLAVDVDQTINSTPYTTSQMAELFSSDIYPFDETWIYQLSDIAQVLSELKAQLPLDRFKANIDSTILNSINEQNHFQIFVDYISDHLQGKTNLLDQVDVCTLIHYMIYCSTENKFTLNLIEMDSIGLFDLFKNDFDLQISEFRNMDLDNKLMNNLAGFMFVQQYRTCFKFMYPERFQRTCLEEQKRLYLQMFSSQSRIYNFVDQLQQCLTEYYDDIQSDDSKRVSSGFQQSNDVFLVLEEILKAMQFYKEYTNETIKLDLTSLSSLVMHFLVQLCQIIDHIDNIPCLLEIHYSIVEKMTICLESLFSINMKTILPQSDSPYRTPVQSPNGCVIQYDNGVIQCILESLDALIDNTDKLNVQSEIYTLLNLVCRIIQYQCQNREFQDLFKRYFMCCGNLISTITVMINKAINKYGQTKNCFACNILIEILVSFYQAKYIITNNVVNKMISIFTLQMQGNEQLKQKCCYLMEKQLSKQSSNRYHNEMNTYKHGFDIKLDLIVLNELSRKDIK